MPTLALADAAKAALTALHGHHRGQSLTPDAREALTGWPGWGPLAGLLEVAPTEAWAQAAEDLEPLLASDALEQASKVCDTAFYTPDLVVDTMFELLRATGFTGGSLLEPGCGSGRFISRAPLDMEIAWTGVEVDPTSARIAQALHPAANIINAPLQHVAFGTGQFDAAIGNVPFSSSHVFDPAYASAPLHEYFLLRALNAVRVGGYVIAVTSRHTMDAEHGLSRLLQQADLRAAIRLPAAAFKDEGTEVVADIVLLQRREDDASPSGWDDHTENTHPQPESTSWGYRPSPPRSRRFIINQPLRTTQTHAQPVAVNRYWEVHPTHVAGQMKVTGYHRSPLTVTTTDPVRDITRAATAVAPCLPPCGVRPDLVPALDAADTASEDSGYLEGGFYLVEGGVAKLTDGALTPVRATAELRALIGLRDAALVLLAAEADVERPDDLITPLREAALGLYETYVARWGALNRGTLHEGKVDPDTGLPALSWRRPSLGGFRRDPNYVTVLALENYDPTTDAANPAPVLLRRVNRPPAPIERVDTPGEALSVSLGEGALSLPRVAELLGIPGSDAAAALGDLVYSDPSKDGEWVIARDYLSGDVRTKLAVAETAAATDPTYLRNVDALAAVLPADLTEHDIKVSLGSPVLTAEDVKAFLLDVFGQHIRVTHTPVIAAWELDHTYSRPTPEAALLYGTSRMTPAALVEHGLNAKSPTVWDDTWQNHTKKRIRNQVETLAAEEKLTVIAERFSTWVWEESERSERIKNDYNRRFNSHVTRRHDGSHLTFPGMADGVTLWPWQRDIVDRIVSSPRTLCGHAVGSGKTKSMVAAAWTLRRFGLANKPLIVVPSHLLEQIAREAQQTFPLGKFLIATKEDLDKESRRHFAARCANGDWDAVVMTHQAFTSLPVAPQVETNWLEDQKRDLRSHLQTDATQGRGAKQIARMVRSFDSRLSELRHARRDQDTVLFEHLGIDFIAVDECFGYDTLVLTDQGPIPIGRIVEEALAVSVASVNLVTGEMEYKPIRRWVRKAAPEQMVQVTHEGGVLTCTPNHPVWIEGKGYVCAEEIAAGDVVRTVRSGVPDAKPTSNVLQQHMLHPRLGCTVRGPAGLPDVSEGFHARETHPEILLDGVSGRAPAHHRNPDMRQVRRTVLRSDSAALLRPRLQTPRYVNGHETDVRSRVLQVWDRVRGTFFAGALLLRIMQDSRRSRPPIRPLRLRTMRNPVQPNQAKAAVLLSKVLGQVAHEPTRVGVDRAAGAGGSEESRRFRTGAGRKPSTDAGEQPYAGSGYAGEGGCFDVGAQLVVSQWGERATNRSAGPLGGEDGSCYGVLYQDPDSDASVRVTAAFLRGRFGAPGVEDGDRSGRSQPQNPQVALPGSPEDGGLERARVVCVEVLERGGPVRSGQGLRGDRDCDRFVYNLEVADNHNYFADGVMVSNCHYFKRLPIVSRADGFSMGASKRATDLLLKIDTLGLRNLDRPHVALFTGTPWSNTIAETFVWQRYLQPEVLAAAGVDHFDAWAAVFVRYETRVEVTPDGGGFRLHRRPGVIQNATDLFSMFAQVADLLPADAIDLERPDSTVHNVAIDATPTQRSFVADLAARADKIRSGNPDGDNMLVVCGDGRRVALDPRLVALNEDSPKVLAVADRVARVYADTTRDLTYPGNPKPGALQLLLCDLGTPHPGNTQTYGRLRTELVARGIPAEKIRWIHEAKTDKARAALFAACRDGDVAVLIGSTDKVGVGVNIQTRLRAIHHVDAPWRPSDLEQRDGRGLRPGNLNPHIDIVRYVVTGTFDSYMWQTLERKARFVAQAFQADGPVREIEDLGDMVLSYGEVKALATGNPHLLKQATLAAEAKRLRTMRSLHQRGINDARKRAADSSRRSEALNQRAATLTELVHSSTLLAPDERDRAALETFIAGLKNDCAYTVRWRGLTVHHEKGRHRSRTLSVRICVGYREVGAIEISRQTVRRATPTAVGILADDLASWVDSVPQTLDRVERDAVAAEEDAVAASQVADSAVFPHTTELAAVEAKLTTLLALIETQATDGQSAA